MSAKGVEFKGCSRHDLRSHWPATDCLRAFGPKSGKKGPKIEKMASPGKRAEKWPKNGKSGPKMPFFSHFRAILPIFRPFFCPFPRWGHKPFFGLFSPISGRRPERQSVAGQWDLKSWPKPPQPPQPPKPPKLSQLPLYVLFCRTSTLSIF